jgi:hypothetical protein
MVINLQRRDASHSYVEGKRYHVTPIGELPGVTTILSVTNGHSFKQWRDNNPEESQRCLNRGLALHDACERYFDYLKMPASSKLFNKLYKDILKDVQCVVTEHQVYSRLGFSGSLDCLGYWHNQLTLFDWKTSTKRKTPSQVVDYLLQVSAYAYALNELDGITVNKAAVVIISEELERCQLFELNGDLINTYFAEFEKRLKWFQSRTAIAS